VVPLLQTPSARTLLLLPLLLSTLAIAQSTSAPDAPHLSPQSAYEQVMRPLEITRRAISNWSDAETTALAIAVKQATEACAARTPDQFSGDDLIAYARLCALGQQWPTVNIAATRYITSTDSSKPQLAQAYALQVGAALHTNDPKAILADSLAMLNAVPYTSVTDETLSGALHYLQIAFTPEALTLYAARQPSVLAALRSPQTVPPATADEVPVPIHTLYADGLAFAALQQFAGDAAAALKTVAELDAALPVTLQPDDSIPITETRRQYALLGAHLPVIQLSLSLFSPTETPRINTNYGSSTVLFLFPDWCAQCVRLAQQILPTLFRVSENQVHLYALLAQPAPPVAAPPAASPRSATRPGSTKESLALRSQSARSAPATGEPTSPEPPKTAAELLRRTPTLIVPPATLMQFAATDFPLLIATDSKGIIRFIQPASETALNPGDFVDQVTMHIARQWPGQTPSAATAPPASIKP
jgi:hypothetical protein